MFAFAACRLLVRPPDLASSSTDPAQAELDTSDPIASCLASPWTIPSCQKSVMNTKRCQKSATRTSPGPTTPNRNSMNVSRSDPPADDPDQSFHRTIAVSDEKDVTNAPRESVDQRDWRLGSSHGLRDCLNPEIVINHSWTPAKITACSPHHENNLRPWRDWMVSVVWQ